MKIGIFDSGIGGLSVLHHAMKEMPGTEFIYYADEAHVPYGEKTVEEIRGYVEHILHFLIEKGVDGIVIACNTATSVSDHEFRAQFSVPIVGMEPAVKKAVELWKDSGKRILVAATPVTIAGDKLHHLLERVDTEQNVDLVPLPKLVRFAEHGIFESPEIDAYLREQFQVFDLSQYAAIVLGCTHFNYFKESFAKVFPQKIQFIDGNEGTINQLKRVVDLQEQRAESSDVTYYYSEKPVTAKEQSEIEHYMRQLEQMYSFGE